MKKILFIDDEFAITSITEMFFNQKGYEYIIAHSGEEAITAIDSNKEDIGIIFLDLMMPDISGFEVLQYMAKQNIQITTIIQSGMSNQEAKQAVLDLGAKAFITKPYSKHILFEYIEQYIAK